MIYLIRTDRPNWNMANKSPLPTGISTTVSPQPLRFRPAAGLDVRLESRTPTDSMTNRVPCTRCRAEILPATASKYHGRCASCSKRSGLKIIWQYVLAVFGIIGIVISTPFVAVGYGVRMLWRRFRFPFDRRELFSAISAVHIDHRIASSYLLGVINGYFDASPIFLGWGRNRSAIEGRNDGGRLFRGEICISDIPTYRTPLTGRPPQGVRYTTNTTQG